MQRIYIDRMYAGLLWVEPGALGPEWHAEDRAGKGDTFDSESAALDWLELRMKLFGAA